MQMCSNSQIAKFSSFDIIFFRNQYIVIISWSVEYFIQESTVNPTIAMASAEATACCVTCYQEYDEDTRRAVGLDCSHTFCVTCLLKLQTDGERMCPTCRKYWRSDLLKDFSSENENNIKTGDKANDVCCKQPVNLSFWCDTCQILFCNKCIQRHLQCDWSLSASKCQFFVDEYERSSGIMRNSITSANDTIWSVNQSALYCIRNFTKKCQKVERQLADEMDFLYKHQIERNSMFLKSQESFIKIRNENDVLKLKVLLKSMQELVAQQNQLSNNPSLLLNIADVYQVI